MTVQTLTSFVWTGLQNLRRYFELMVFQSYLQSIEPDTMQSFETFESFVEDRPGTLLALGSVVLR